jgi:VanZ family protein
VIEYAILSALLFRAWRGQVPGFWRRALMTFLPAVIFAVADEYHQSFVASRTSSPVDVLIDSCGAFIGILICRTTYLAQLRRATRDTSGTID